jgi:hypothetical protein
MAVTSDLSQRVGVVVAGNRYWTTTAGEMSAPRALQIPSRKSSWTLPEGGVRPPPACLLRPTPSAWTATKVGAPARHPQARPPAEHALISLLAVNGQRSEDTGVDIERWVCGARAADLHTRCRLASRERSRPILASGSLAGARPHQLHDRAAAASFQ